MKKIVTWYMGDSRPDGGSHICSLMSGNENIEYERTIGDTKESVERKMKRKIGKVAFDKAKRVEVQDIRKGYIYLTELEFDGTTYRRKELCLAVTKSVIWFFLINEYPCYSKKNMAEILKLTSRKLTNGYSYDIDEDIDKQIVVNDIKKGKLETIHGGSISVMKELEEFSFEERKIKKGDIVRHKSGKHNLGIPNGGLYDVVEKTTRDGEIVIFGDRSLANTFDHFYVDPKNYEPVLLKDVPKHLMKQCSIKYKLNKVR